MERPPATLRTHGITRWREVVKTTFLALDCRAESPSGFESRAVMTRMGDATAADLCVSASRVWRRRRDAENDECPYFKVFWQVTGHSRIQQGRHQATLQPGAWSLYDTSREYTIESSDRARFVVLLLPQSQCPNWSPLMRELAGSAIRDSGAAHVALSGLLGLLHGEMPLDQASQEIVRSSTGALIERALWSEIERRGVSGGLPERPVLDRVQAFIVEHSADPALTPESVAEAFGICRRTLYSVFASSDLTPRAFIQHVRLGRASALLREASWRAASVGQIARHCGFADTATFSRAFHAHFGVAPSVWRKGGS